MKAIYLLTFLLNGCFMKFEPPHKLYLKRIATNETIVEWYFYSTISTSTPDYLVLTTKGMIDTICVAHNIKDVSLEDSTIQISFYGKPSLYDHNAVVKMTMNYKIIIDTAFSQSPEARKFFTLD
jgi:hypothetical protein